VNTYIRNRLRADAAHLVGRSQVEEGIVHTGMRGRFRELLVDTILSPWLPPYAACGTGMIVDDRDRSRDSTQEDVVIFDSSLVPAVLAHSEAMEGVFPLDGVLARVEVKSCLTKKEVKTSIAAARGIYELNFSGQGKSVAPISALFGFRTNLTKRPDDDLNRLLKVADEGGLYSNPPAGSPPCPITVLCVVGKGCWVYYEFGDRSFWIQAKMTDRHDEILFFVGLLSNACFKMHLDRLGTVRDKARGAGGGIGNFIFDDRVWEESTIQAPPSIETEIEEEEE
jgi:hypothetical protein